MEDIVLIEELIKKYQHQIDESNSTINLCILKIKTELIRYRRLKKFTSEQINYIISEIEQYGKKSKENIVKQR